MDKLLLPSIPFLHHLRIPKNRRFSDAFRECKKGTQGSNGLKSIFNQPTDKCA